MSDLDIGALTGKIELDDQMSSALELVSSKLEKFGEQFGGVMGGVALSAGLAVGAIAAVTGAIVALGEKGSTVQGVTEAYDHLAQTAGTTGDALREAFSTGLKGTVDNMDIMQSTTRLLSSGMKLTTDQATLMGEASRALGKATGTDAANGLNTLSTALMTGRVRTLQQQIGMVDLATAETNYAHQLGLTNKGELNQRQKLLADQGAILQATKTYVDRLGESELTFKEKMAQGTVAVREWVDRLSVAVSTSPAVNSALDAVGSALTKAFGKDGQGAIDTIVGMINNFANVVKIYGPVIINFFKDVYDWSVKWKTVLEDIDKFNPFGGWMANLDKLKQKAQEAKEIQELGKDKGTSLTFAGVQVGSTSKDVNLAGAATAATETIDPIQAKIQSLMDKFTGQDVSAKILQMNSALEAMAEQGLRMTVAEAQALGPELEKMIASGANIGKLTPLYEQWKNSFAGMKPLLDATEKAQQAAFAGQQAYIQEELQLTGASLAQKEQWNDQYYDSKNKQEQDSTDHAIGTIQAELSARLHAVNQSTQAGKDLAASYAREAEQQINALDIKSETDQFTNNVARAKASIQLMNAEFQTTQERAKALNDIKIQGLTDQMGLAQAQMNAYGATFDEITAATDAYYAAKHEKEQADWDFTRATLINTANASAASTKTMMLAMGQTEEAAQAAADKILNIEVAQVQAGDASFNIKRITENIEETSAAAARLHDRFGDNIYDLDRMSRDAGEVYSQMIEDDARYVQQNRIHLYSVQQLDTAYQKWQKSVIDLYDALHPKILSFIDDMGKISGILGTMGQNLGSQTISNIGLAVGGIGNLATAWKNAAAQAAEYRKNTGIEEQWGAGSSGGPTGPTSSQLKGIALQGMFTAGQQGAAAPSVGSGLIEVGATAAQTTATLAILQGSVTGMSVALGAMTFGIGAAVIGITAWIRSAQHAAQVQKELNQTLDQTHQQVQQEFGTTGGTLAQAYENASKQAVKFGLAIADATGDASHHSSEDIARVNAQLKALDDILQEVAADASKMGLTFADMDPSDAADAANKAATALEHTFTIMTQAGYKSDAVIKGMAPDLNAWLSQALQAGVKIPAAMQPIITQLIQTHQLTEANAEALMGMANDGTPSLADITAAANRYGLSLDNLGSKVSQLTINDQAAQIQKDFKTLTDAGASFDQIMTTTATDTAGNVTTVASGMETAIQSMVEQALKAGVSIPEGMKPIIQTLVDQGKLVDENGNKLTDISRLDFEQPIADKIDALIGKLGDFIDTMTGKGEDGATGATTTMANTTTTATQSMTTDWGKATSGVNAYITSLQRADTITRNMPPPPSPNPTPAPAPPSPNPAGGGGSSNPQSQTVNVVVDGEVVARATINGLDRAGV